MIPNCYRIKKLHAPLRFLPRNTIQFSIPTIPSYFSSLSPLPSDTNHNKLNHKDWLSPNEVLKIFENLNDPDSVISVWNQYRNRKDYKPNEAIYTLVINKLAQGKSFDAIDGMMQRIKLEKSACRLSSDFFHNVIKIYCHYGSRIQSAIDTLLDMPRGYNCWPDVKSFNLVLNLLVSARRFDEVRAIYAKAPLLGVEIDACCLNILIKGLCQNGELESAFYVFDEFPKQRCRPNVRTFSTLMHGLCEKGKVEEAFGLLERMEKEGIVADTIMFNILISGLRKQGRVEEGIELLKGMKGKGCEPDEASYQEVLYGLLDVEKYVEAKEFTGRMLSLGMKPSFESYKKLIGGFCKENLIEDVDWGLKQMVKQGFVPKMRMWGQIMGRVIQRKNASNSIDINEIVDG